MSQLKRGAHTTYQAKYHLVWILWGANLWGRGYFASTVNDKTASGRIRKYIEDQKRQQKQLNFLDRV